MFSMKMELECRVCLDQTMSVLTYIFDTDLLEGYERCSSLKVNHEDPLPKYLCSACCSLIRSFNEFRQRCIDSQIKYCRKVQAVKELKNPPTRTLSKREFKFDETPSQGDSDSDIAADASTVLPEVTYKDLEQNQRTKKDKHIKRKEKKETNNTELVDLNVADSDSIAQKQKSPRKNRQKKKLKEKMVGGQCDICQKIFLYRNSLISHIRRCTSLKDMENEISKLCGICEETFQSTKELNDHLGFHQSTNTIECKICPYKAIDFADLFGHRFSHQHLGLRSRMYCFLCPRFYRKITSMEYHFRGVHMKKEKPGICKTCKKEYKCYKHYVEHLSMHMGKLLTCDQCARQFKYEGLLYRHKQTHGEERKYMCHLCGFSSKLASGLRSHTFHRHKQHEPIICNHCGKTFKNSHNHRAHMLRVQGEQSGTVRCPVCSKSFRSEKEMLHHFKWHTNDKPYVCDICGSAYKAKCHLKVHSRVHTGETPYACGICDMRFVTTNSFNRHVLLHSGEKPYTCSICEKKFALKSNLKKHITRHGTSKKVEQARL